MKDVKVFSRSGFVNGRIDEKVSKINEDNVGFKIQVDGYEDLNQVVYANNKSVNDELVIKDGRYFYIDYYNEDEVHIGDSEDLEEVKINYKEKKPYSPETLLDKSLRQAKDAIVKVLIEPCLDDSEYIEDMYDSIGVVVKSKTIEDMIDGLRNCCWDSSSAINFVKSEITNKKVRTKMLGYIAETNELWDT